MKLYATAASLLVLATNVAAFAPSAPKPRGEGLFLLLSKHASVGGLTK